MDQSRPVQLQEVLPKSGLVVSEKGNLSEVRSSRMPRAEQPYTVV